jgi:hypothetical protein
LFCPEVCPYLHPPTTNSQFSFQSNLPALFPVNNLFELAQENAKIDDATDVAQESGKINTEEKLTAKKDKRKLRHEKFLKSENCLTSKIVWL